LNSLEAGREIVSRLVANDGKPAVLLMGPTASGKTDLAVELVTRFPFEIVSVDSAMVYRGMDIGTAKPDSVTLERAPHRLIDILDPWESYSAARFRTDALREMHSICRAGRLPLLAGGTMLYFRALQFGLSPMPAADPVIRAEIAAEAERDGWTAMHASLARVDPVAALRIHPHDPQRIQRALEVYRITGRSMTALWEARESHSEPFRLIPIVLSTGDRGLLHHRIEQRFDQMLTNGLVEEVAGLRRRPELTPSLPSMRAVGYRQVWEYLDGGIAAAEMRRRAIVATRRFAKRQLTWLRGMPSAERFDSQSKGLLQSVIDSLCVAEAIGDHPPA
jgi:tRNA dimethylallyltransferase